ncbi:MAG: FAD-dependent oxidoreductase [Deltaproteobacteria bacterium]|nr:FAD-dependent oxidoreductase [Deltaproteobacteria bacterium]
MPGDKDLVRASIIEEACRIDIYRDTDVLVVGGGPAGTGAALASARNGARTILLERFGYLGGLATGGFVLCIMPMSDGTNEQQIAGICQEIIDRLDDAGAAVHPRKEDLGSSDKKLLNHWRRYPFTVIGNRIVLSAQIDPEILKCILNDMMEEAGVELLLHSLGCRAIVDDNRIKGVFFESKSGRQAILAKTVIDTTGDGDIYASAGAAFGGMPKSDQRAAKLSFTFRFSRIDSKRFHEFKETEKIKYSELMRECTEKGGFTHAISCTPDDVMWFNNQLSGLDGLDIKDLTQVEISGRKRMRITYDFFKKYVPGFENCYLMDTATQTGVRCTRRLTGEYVVTMEDIDSGVVHEDTILEAPSFIAPVTEKPHIHVPYRCLVPEKIDNLLASGRCVSADEMAINILSPIQFCIGTGQAAGTAAAMAVKEGITPRKINYRKLQECLMSQNVKLNT